MDLLLRRHLPTVYASLESFSRATSLPTLPLHVHQVVIALLVYHSIFLFLSPLLSRWLLPQFYNAFPRRTKINWDVHVVSFIQAVFICGLALWGMVTDVERGQWKSETQEGTLSRVFGYTAAGGAVQGYATGYFVWDLVISAYYVDIFGVGFVAHALSALLVFGLGFRPFVNYYAPIFILFELSSPFLNIHWFCDKINKTGSRLQLINGIFLLTTFFGCRILWGSYNSVLVFRDIFSIYFSPPHTSTAEQLSELTHPDKHTQEPITPMHFEGRTVPLWLAAVYLGSNICLNGLNYYWFARMIQTVSARFTGTKGPGFKEKELEEEKVWIEGMDMDFGTGAEIVKKDAEELRRRYSQSFAKREEAAS